jgi:hypothetical protein
MEKIGTILKEGTLKIRIKNNISENWMDIKLVINATNSLVSLYNCISSAKIIDISLFKHFNIFETKLGENTFELVTDSILYHFSAASKDEMRYAVFFKVYN